MASDEPTAYVAGEYVPESEAAVPVTDPGFRWGYNVYDVLRTYGGDPFMLDAHLDRLERSCRSVGIDLHLGRDTLREVVERVLDSKVERLEDGDDAMAYVTVSGAWSVHDGRDVEGDPRVVVTAHRIPFEKNARKYVEGARLTTTGTRQVPPTSVPPRIKHQSRLHFVLADHEAKRADPDSLPLLLDAEGNVTEMAHANVFAVVDGTLLTPPGKRVLEGVSRSVVLDLAGNLDGVTAREGDLQPYDLYRAEEVFYTNTTQFVTPVVGVDGRTVGDGRPGAVTERLLEAGSERVGLDIVAQFLRSLPKEDRPGCLRLGGDESAAPE